LQLFAFYLPHAKPEEPDNPVLIWVKLKNKLLLREQWLA